MDKIRFPIVAVTLYMLLFNMFPFLGVGYSVLGTMFLLSPLVTIWMVIKVLKDGEASKKTFDNYWYEDQAL